VNNKYQTIIIGAGPAGLTAGKYLKDALILEKEKEIGKPVQCGEGISHNSLEEQGIKPDPAWISATIDTIEVCIASGRKASFKGEKLGYILDRTVFEKALAQKCKAEIRLNTKVVDIKKQDGLWEIKTEKGEIFKSEYLIGADGPLSIVRRKLFQEQKIEVLPTYEYLVELEKEIPISIMQLYFDKERFPGGYVWIFPKSKNTANIGLGGTENLAQRFHYFMEKVVRPEFGNYKLLENKSGTITWGGAKIKLYKDKVFLVGDAGALVDPVLGGGMNNAMVSAKIAAQSILSNTPHLFEKRVKSLRFFSRDLITAQEILYSLPNSVLDELVEALNKRGLSVFETLSGIFSLVSQPELRKNAFKITKLLFIIRKNGTSLG